MRLATLIDATDLASWANRRDAQGALPQLLRRLIHATVERVLRAGFPAGEGVQLGGWDGVVAVEQGNAFVPNGTSTWELGVNRDIKGKADDDYEKRRGDPRGIDPAQSTFVFITPRRWGRKDEWVTARRTEGIWRDVRAYDADDLEQWLELAPAVHVWLSILLGKHPEGTVDLGSFWEDWSAATRPATPSELVLAGRNNVVQASHDWLPQPVTPLALQAESREEALAVFAAALQKLPEEQRAAVLSRAVIVHDVEAWHRLTASDQPLLLILAFDNREALGRAARTGHKVVIPLGRADSTSAKTVEIPRLSREEALKAIVATGINEDRARDLAMLARRSLTSFRRKLALSAEVQQPEWARPANARSLLPVMLAGGWNDTIDGDRQGITTLAQAPYDEISATVVRWVNEADPPMRRVGAAWFIISKEDAWSLLARYLTREDLERFESVVIEVLGSPDPRFDLPDSQRWMANALGHSPKYSGLFREGIADTLAIMGARGDTTNLTGGISACDYATRSVRRLLEQANTDWRIWASLFRSLSLLAEAAPDTFLDAVERGLTGESPVLLNLFSDQQDALFSSAPHPGLLWALETLAWSSEHLGRAALVLAKLTRLDPGGKLANRPQRSLRSIFLPWAPQTAATLERRCRVFDAMHEREPEVTWQLWRQLLPKFLDSGDFTPKPRWREWIPDSPRHVTQEEHLKAVREVVSRMLIDVGKDGSRWQDLIEALPALSVDQHEAVVERLANIDADLLISSDRAAIWNALRKVISHHRSFPNADWALPKERIDRLDEIFKRFEPQEPVAHYSWLFSNHPELPEGRQDNWEARQETLANARLAAVRTIYAQSSIEGIFEFLGLIEQPGELGLALGQGDLADREEDKLLSECLAASDAPRRQFARGFVVGRIRSRNREWAEDKFINEAKDWPSNQRAEILACLPYDERTWNLTEGSDPEVVHQYWCLISPYGIGDADVERVGRKFLQHGRPYTAVQLLTIHMAREQVLSARFIADVLEQVLQTSPKDDRPDSSFAHDVSELLDLLVASKEVDEQRIAALEWGFLPLLERRYKRTLRLLHRELARDPNFFSELINLAFCAEGEEPQELSEEEQMRANRAYDLLKSWRTVPGMAEDGNIDAEMLKGWVWTARKATTASGRGVVGDQIIGQTLSGSPSDADGAWPHSAVCAVIEEVASRELEDGFELSVCTSRGTVVKHPYAGGASERQLAEQYSGFALALSDRWPRTAAMLRRISEQYQAEARREDQEAELREDLAQ